MDTTKVFAHERLVAYARTCEFLARTAGLLHGLPRGEASLADQLRRAGDSVLLNLCEGAGRTAGREKAHYYDVALGSATECAAALAILAIRRLASRTDVAAARSLLHEVVCMLTALARRARERAE
jgi:four helix bundle protein